MSPWIIGISFYVIATATVLGLAYQGGKSMPPMDEEEVQEQLEAIHVVPAQKARFPIWKVYALVIWAGVVIWVTDHYDIWSLLQMYMREK